MLSQSKHLIKNQIYVTFERSTLCIFHGMYAEEEILTFTY
jgi:hypothetical protein